MKAATKLRDEIRRVASRRGLKAQQDLAGALGITPTYLSDILKHRKRLTPALVDKAIAILDVNGIQGQRWHRLGAVESGWRIDVRLG